MPLVPVGHDKCSRVEADPVCVALFRGLLGALGLSTVAHFQEHMAFALTRDNQDAEALLRALRKRIGELDED
jgi:hypothetical protein